MDATDEAVLGIDAASLPIVWDADFLYGPRTTSGNGSYALSRLEECRR